VIPGEVGILGGKSRCCFDARLKADGEGAADARAKQNRQGSCGSVLPTRPVRQLVFPTFALGLN